MNVCQVARNCSIDSQRTSPGSRRKAIKDELQNVTWTLNPQHDNAESLTDEHMETMSLQNLVKAARDRNVDFKRLQ